MVLMVRTGWPWFVADTRDTKKKLHDRKLVANSDRVPSIVIGTMPGKAMERFCDRNNARKGNGKHEKKRTSTSKGTW
jgi:hypothetical protein